MNAANANQTLTTEQKIALAKLLPVEIVAAFGDKFFWDANGTSVSDTAWDYVVRRIKEQMTPDEQTTYFYAIAAISKATYMSFATLSEQADAIIATFKKPV